MQHDYEAGDSGVMPETPDLESAEPRKKPNVRRGIALGVGGLTFVIGVVLVIAGSASLLNGGPHRAADPAVLDIGDTDRTPEAEAAAPTAVPTPPLGDAGYQFVIDKLGVEAPVQTFGLDENAIPKVPTGDNAADVVAWYNFSAKPGTGSNAVFAGHVTWWGPAVFYNLTSLAEGDAIKLRGQDGTELTYVVSSVFSIDATDPDAVQVMWASKEDVITIITCDGTFTHDPNDHVSGGSYNNRLVVRAALQSVALADAGPAEQGPVSGG
jgi:sortase A